MAVSLGVTESLSHAQIGVNLHDISHGSHTPRGFFQLSLQYKSEICIQATASLASFSLSFYQLLVCDDCTLGGEGGAHFLAFLALRGVAEG